MYLFNTNIIWCTHIHAHEYICLKKITLNYKQTKKICFRGITLESWIFTYATQSVSFFCKTHISETVLIVLIDWVTIPISRDTSYSASFTWTKSVGVCVCVIQYEFVCLCVCVCVSLSGGKENSLFIFPIHKHILKQERKSYNCCEWQQIIHFESLTGVSV